CLGTLLFHTLSPKSDLFFLPGNLHQRCFRIDNTQQIRSQIYVRVRFPVFLPLQTFRTFSEIGYRLADATDVLFFRSEGFQSFSVTLSSLAKSISSTLALSSSWLGSCFLGFTP